MAFTLFPQLEMEKWVPLAFTRLPELQLFLETSESLEMHIFSGGGKLQIARSQVSDSGTYTCVASNVEGSARKSYNLTIQGMCNRCACVQQHCVCPGVDVTAFLCQSHPVSLGQSFLVKWESC